MEIRTNIGVKIDGCSYISDLINSIFSLNTIIKLRWKQRQREAINAYISCNGNQNSAGIIRLYRNDVSNYESGVSRFASADA